MSILFPYARGDARTIVKELMTRDGALSSFVSRSVVCNLINANGGTSDPRWDRLRVGATVDLLSKTCEVWTAVVTGGDQNGGWTARVPRSASWQDEIEDGCATFPTSCVIRVHV